MCFMSYRGNVSSVKSCHSSPQTNLLSTQKSFFYFFPFYCLILNQLWEHVWQLLGLRVLNLSLFSLKGYETKRCRKQEVSNNSVSQEKSSSFWQLQHFSPITLHRGDSYACQNSVFYVYQENEVVCWFSWLLRGWFVWTCGIQYSCSSQALTELMRGKGP